MTRVSENGRDDIARVTQHYDRPAACNVSRRMLWLAAAALLLGGVSRASDQTRPTTITRTAASRPQRRVPRDLGPATRREVAFASNEPPGTLIIDTNGPALYLFIGSGRAIAYRIGIGREGFGWTGIVKVGAKAEWPNWHPTAEMRSRDPLLPEHVPPGPLNPLGARAIYLHSHGKDTLYRIHGTNEPETLGQRTSSGCFRLSNTDVIDLYARVKIGVRVIVY